MPPSTFGIDLPLLVPVLGLVFSNPRFSKLLGFSGARVRLLGMWLSRVRVGLGSVSYTHLTLPTNREV